MKTETRTREEYYNVYVANDGTEFSDKAECEKYEQSAKAVVNNNYLRLVVGTNTEEAFFGMGCCDNRVEFVKVASKEDADVVMQMNFLINPHMGQHRESYDATLERMHNLLERAISEDDLLMVGRGYDDDSFWFIGTHNSLKEEIDNICKVSIHAKEAEEL